MKHCKTCTCKVVKHDTKEVVEKKRIEKVKRVAKLTAWENDLRAATERRANVTLSVRKVPVDDKETMIMKLQQLNEKVLSSMGSTVYEKNLDAYLKAVT